jgi:ATPase family associated with various cellular activities (AAA)
MKSTTAAVRQERWKSVDADMPNARKALNTVLASGAATVSAAQIDLSAAIATSLLTLPGYSTVDDAAIQEIRSKVTRIATYVSDDTATRPLTFLLSAEPGSGKSHFVKCIAGDIGIPMVTANVASLQSMAELGYWIDEIRDHKTQDKTPLLLIDEADSKPYDIPAFLPLLWDGLFSWQGRSLKIGRCVIVLVASNESLRRYIEDGSGADVKEKFPKIEDLLSRINGGVVRLPPIDERRHDKLCIALALIRRRFPQLTAVQLPFVKLLVNTRFMHSVRSMEALIEYFPAPSNDGTLRVTTEFEQLLLDHFLKRETFRANVFAFHLEHGERVNANQIWSEHRDAQVLVSF